MKRCPKCKTSRPLQSFYKDQSRKDGLQPWCKPCCIEAKAAWLARNRDKARTYGREYARAHRDQPKHRAYMRAWWKKNSHRYKDKERIRTYGLTLDAYRAMIQAQGSVCAICRKACATRQRLSVDHDHQTGIVRGLLCRKCNLGIGHLGDDPAILQRAIDYLLDNRRKEGAA